MHNLVVSLIFVIITVVAPLQAQPLLISATYNDLTCYESSDGSIDVLASGGVGGYTYSWNHDLFYTSSSSNTLIAGFYSITVSDGINTDSVSVVIRQPQKVLLQARKQNAGCGLPNGSISLLCNYADSSGVVYHWGFSSTYKAKEKNNLLAGDYEVWATVGSCSSDTLIATIIDIPPPFINVYDTLTINIGESITIYNTFLPSEGISLLWTPSQGLSCTDCIFPTASPEQSTDYICTIYDSLARCTSQDTCKMTVKTPAYFVQFPNTFTPNGDYINDNFFVRGYGIKKITFQVYDKFGAMLFETTDPRTGWDGTFKGRTMSTDVFTYQAYGEYIDDKKFIKNGAVTLIR